MERLPTGIILQKEVLKVIGYIQIPLSGPALLFRRIRPWSRGEGREGISDLIACPNKNASLRRQAARCGGYKKISTAGRGNSTNSGDHCIVGRTHPTCGGAYSSCSV